MLENHVLRFSKLRIGVTYTSRRKVASMRVGVIGVPFYEGQGRVGVDQAPNALREAGLIKSIINLGHNVKDFGDVSWTPPTGRFDLPDKLKKLPELSACTHELSCKVVEIMKDNRMALTLGGDHSVVLGSIDGHITAKGDNLCVLWVDAHADLNTADTSDTGSLHGMPVAMLVKELADYWPYLPGMDWQIPRLSIKNLAYIGLRSVDAYERMIIEKFDVAAFAMEDIDKFGIHDVTQLALERINPNGEKTLHVSFDIDSLDSLEAPSTGTSVRGGLTLREAVHVMEVAHRSGKLEAVDLVEVNPLIGDKKDVKRTLEAAIEVSKAAFGHSRHGVIPKHVKRIPGYYRSEEPDILK